MPRTRARPPTGTEPADPSQDAERVALPGSSLVAKRALQEIVRNAALGSYGVTGLVAPTRLARVRSRLGLGGGPVRVGLRPQVSAQVWLEVAFGLPVAEVARQVDSAIRYELQRAVGRPVGPIELHVQGLRGGRFTSPGPAPGTDSDAQGGSASAEPPAGVGAAPDPGRNGHEPGASGG